MNVAGAGEGDREMFDAVDTAANGLEGVVGLVGECVVEDPDICRR